jgi:uncharacterized protein YrrD
MQQAESLPRTRQARGITGDSITWLGNGLAVLLSVLAIAAGVVGVLVAFDVIGNAEEPFEDGMAWLLGGVVLSLAANVFRREHHLASSRRAYAQVGEERVRHDGADRVQREPKAQARDVNDVTGMTVVTTEEARDVGTVRDVLFDPKEMAVLALVIAPAGMKDGRMFVEREFVRGFGRDAVTIQSESTMRAFATKGREREFSDGGVRLDGVRVMTERGDNVGKVRKVLVADDCRIVALEAGGGVFRGRRRIDADDIVAIGRERLIVSRKR